MPLTNETRTATECESLRKKTGLLILVEQIPLTIFGFRRLCSVWWQAGFAPGWFPGVGWEVQILPLPGPSSVC